MIPRSSKLTGEAIQQLDNLLEFASAEDYRNTLIEIYHTYILREHKMLPVGFSEMAGQMLVLIDFFREVGEEMDGGGGTRLRQERD